MTATTTSTALPRARSTAAAAVLAIAGNILLVAIIASSVLATLGAAVVIFGSRLL